MTRDEFIEAVSKIGLIGAARAGELDDMLTGAGSVTDQQILDAIADKPSIVALTPIADPDTATTPQVARLVNQVIAALKTA